ncbi:heavy metal sensor histidine kinase [Acinetobacter sp. WU_MDCI_Axc73]|nr:heavy metal sensor histidine kinase [Acinetobacter sp. WU_MDCI_Axc73]
MQVRSLEFRLTLLVTLVCTAILCLVGTLTYWGIDRILLREQDQALAARIERLEILLQDSTNIEQIIQKPKLYQNMLGDQDNLFILIQGQNKLIDINPLNIHIPQLIFTKQNIHFIDLKENEHPTRIAWKNFDIAGRPYQLIAGKQWSERLSILHSFGHDLSLYFALGLIILCLLCWVVCHLSLTGLRELTRQTKQFRIQSLQQRITIQHQSLDVMQLTDAINLMLQRIEQGYQQLNRFSENIAHEFRTPLNNLIGQTEILLSESRSTENYEDLLVSHLEEYQRLKRMIDSMLFLARADQQQIELDLQTIDLPEFVENILNFYDLLASEKNIKIVSHIQPHTMKADEELLQRALCNLIENAILHGPAFGKIEITISTIFSENKTMLKISVLSVDVYLDSQHLEHLFERFYQCQTSRYQQGRSGGLGLSIVSSIMQLHGGSYLAKNTEQGLCFDLYFPINSEI